MPSLDPRQDLERAVSGGHDLSLILDLQRRIEALERRGSRTLWAGQSPLESTAAAPPVDLTTVGPQTTIPADGTYAILFGAGTYVSASTGGFTSYIEVYAGATLLRSLQLNMSNLSLIEYPAAAVRGVALTAGTIVKVRYGALACTAQFLNRWLLVMRLA